MNSFRRILPLLLSALCLAAMFLFAAFSDRYLSVVAEGIALWAAVVLPSLFPFFFLTALLTGLNAVSGLAARMTPVTKRLFRTPGQTAYAFAMSAVSGYPVGAKILATLAGDKQLSPDDATRAACFCTTVSPMFAIGSIGARLLSDQAAGVAIYLCHIAATLVTGMLFRFYGKPPEITAARPAGRTDNLLNEAMASSVSSVLAVGGFIAFFYTVAAMAADFSLLEFLIRPLSALLGERELAEGLVYGLLECTTGSKILAASESALVPALIGFLVSFGGVSVFCQNLVFLKKANVKTAVYLLSKITQAVLSFLFLWLYTLL